MRVMIIHGSQGHTPTIAKGLQQALEQSNCRADLVSAATTGSAPVSTGAYALVCVVSTFTGIFKPQLPAEVTDILRRCTRLEGKKGAAIVQAKLGSGKALRALMGQMEGQGVIVEDFAAVSSPKDISEVARRLCRLG